MAGKKCACFVATTIAACLLAATTTNSLPQAKPSYNLDLVSHRNVLAPTPDPCIKVKSSCPVPEKTNATLLPNPDDCESYCACVWGNPVWMPCPAGLHFNPTLHVCDYPSRAGCGISPPRPTEQPTKEPPTEDVSSSDSDETTPSPVKNGCPRVKYQCPVPERVNATLLPNPDDCGSYCECVWGTPMLMLCPLGLYFNPSLNVCDYPIRAGCGGSPPLTTDPPTKETTTEDVFSTESEDTSPSPVENGCSKVESQCPVPERVNATLLPNPDDCGLYCACVWGTPVLMRCPPGLHFNPSLNVCDYPIRAGCGSSPPNSTDEPTKAPPTGSSPPKSTVEPTKAPPTENVTSSEPDNTTAGPVENGCSKVKSQCPVPERENATLLPNPDDCGSYCACVWGNPVLMRCPPGLHFNPTLNVCDYPIRAGCGSSPPNSTDEPTKAPPTENVTSSEPDNTTAGPVENGCSKVKSQCPVPERENATLLPNPDDCGSYCACVWGNPVLMRCPPGLHFNPTLNVCDYPIRAGCGSSPPNSTDEPTKAPPTGSSPPKSTVEPTKAPPTENVTSSEPDNTTAGPVENGCSKVKSLCPVPERENATLLPNPDDCGSYCACVWGNPVLMRCPPGLHFNPTLNVCDYPIRAGCGSSPPNSTDEPTKAPPTENVTSSEPDNTTAGPVENGCSKVKSQCPVPERENATLLPNPDDCGSYCACVWGNPVLMRCPPGLHFNPTLNVCDYPIRAGCGSSPPNYTDEPTKAPPTENVTSSEPDNTTAGPVENGCSKVKSQCPVPERENATLLPNPDDCGSYCACVWGNPVLMRCPPGLHFNPTLNVCDYPIRAGCGSSPPNSTDEPTKAPPTENVTSSEPDNTTAGPVENGCSKVKSQCPVPERENATLLPNPDDCGSYCACVWGNPVLMRCPPGLHFNPTLNVCDYPIRAGCGSSPPNSTDEPTKAPPTGSSPPKSTVEPTKAPPTENVTSSEPDNTTAGPVENGCSKVKSQCPVPERENATLLPNPDDCGSYCACVWGNPVLMRCPPGLHFNPTLNVCDYSSRAGCGSVTKPTDKPATAPPSPTVTATEISTTTHFEDNSCFKVRSQCPMPEKENATLLPNPDDCGSYCMCVWGTPVWRPCPAGLHFNPTLKVCDYPMDAGCGAVPVTPSKEPSPDPTNTPDWNDKTSTATHGTDSCYKVKSLCPVPEKVNATLLPNPDDCASYCACVWGNPVWMPCPVGLHFNPVLHVCDYPYEAGCYVTPPPPEFF